MTEDEVTFTVCRTAEEMQFAQQAEVAVLDGLGNNILEHLGEVELDKPIRIFIRNREGRVVGGVIANCFGGWMYISLLWVDKSLRNLGYGTQLMQLAETEALRMGNGYAHVDTYSFESRPFYEKLGYKLFATLEDYPPGHCKYFLKKRLVD
jgi:GNAT superfamily N-acetyltransferase